MNHSTAMKSLFITLTFVANTAFARPEMTESKELRALKAKFENVASFVEDNEYDTFDVRLLDIRRFTKYAHYPDFADAARENFLVFVDGDASTEFSFVLENAISTEKQKTALRDLMMPEKNIYYGETDQKDFDKAYKTANDALVQFIKANAKKISYVDAGGSSNTGDCRFGYLSVDGSYDILYVSHCHANDE